MHLNNLAMGGYGVYVWSAYTLTFVVFGINLIKALSERKYSRKKINTYLMRCNHESKT